MSHWIRSTSDPEWAKLFTGYTKSAYRLEGQQIYSNPSEDAYLADFLAGKPLNFDLSWRLPKTRAQIAAGRTKTTVRVVVEPPTDYTRMELTVYPQLVAAGEEIRIISVTEGIWPDSLPRHDYWLFDDHDVWRMHYGEDHRFAGAELLEDPATIADHLEWRDIALAQSVPLQEYLASRQPTG
jgi:hypothetical protein